MTTCRKCRDSIQQRSEKALNGDWALVWSDREGNWVCPSDGDEHDPVETPDQTPVQTANETQATHPLPRRVIHAVVNLPEGEDGGIGAMEWRDKREDLPTFDERDVVYTVLVYDEADDAAITSDLDGLLGNYDVPGYVFIGPDLWYVRLERDHGAPDLSIGPYRSEALAEHAMQESPIVDNACAENCLECYITTEVKHDDDFALIDATDSHHTGLPTRYRLTITSDQDPEPIELDDPEDDYSLGEQVSYILEARDGRAIIQFERIPGVLGTSVQNQHSVAFGETS